MQEEKKTVDIDTTGPGAEVNIEEDKKEEIEVIEPVEEKKEASDEKPVEEKVEEKKEPEEKKEIEEYSEGVKKKNRQAN